MSARTVRAAAIGELVAPTAAVLVTLFVLVPHPAPADAAPVRDRGTVVDSQCIDGRITEAIDDGNPAGWLAYDTGVSC